MSCNSGRACGSAGARRLPRGSQLCSSCCAPPQSRVDAVEPCLLPRGPRPAPVARANEEARFLRRQPLAIAQAKPALLLPGLLRETVGAVIRDRDRDDVAPGEVARSQQLGRLQPRGGALAVVI